MKNLYIYALWLLPGIMLGCSKDTATQPPEQKAMEQKAIDTSVEFVTDSSMIHVGKAGYLPLFNTLEPRRVDTILVSASLTTRCQGDQLVQKEYESQKVSFEFALQNPSAPTAQRDTLWLSTAIGPLIEQIALAMGLTTVSELLATLGGQTVYLRFLRANEQSYRSIWGSWIFDDVDLRLVGLFLPVEQKQRFDSLIAPMRSSNEAKIVSFTIDSTSIIGQLNADTFRKNMTSALDTSMYDVTSSRLGLRHWLYAFGSGEQVELAISQLGDGLWYFGEEPPLGTTFKPSSCPQSYVPQRIIELLQKNQQQIQ